MMEVLVAERPPSPIAEADLARLDAYLDGQMPEAECVAFESELKRRPDLREQLALQERIDEGLRRNLARREVAGEIGLARARRSWWRWVAAAAIALAALPLLWFGARRVLETPLERVYRVTVASGFVPEEVCTTNEAFRAWVASKYTGARLEPEPGQSRVEFVGWSYHKGATLWPYTALLLARAEGRQIVVVMNRKEQIAVRPPAMPRLPGLNVYERVIGKMALYEISPLDHATVIEVLREPVSAP